MSVPQKEKEGPASMMLRAMFAGFGSLMSVMDRVRSKPAAEAPTDTETPAPTAAATEATAEPAPAAEAETVVPETAAPETAVAETATPETAAPETATPETATPETTAESVAAAEPEAVVAETVAPEAAAAETVAPEESGALPLANYDELSVASLRARLRNLSVAQLTQLIEYERDHAERADVIAMFERRIAKIEAEA
jgi:hypothetical protein